MITRKHVQKVEQSLTTQPRDYRKELWVQVAVNVARAENTRDCDAPARWADRILDSFDKRFGKNES